MLAKLIQWHLSWRTICNRERRQETSKISFGCYPWSYRKNLKSMFYTWNLWQGKILRHEIYYHLQTTEAIHITLLKYSWWKTFDKQLFKTHVAWRLMIPADKRSHFKAPPVLFTQCTRLKLHLQRTKISWRLALRYFPEFRFDSKSKNDVINSYLRVQGNSICCFNYA